MSKLFLGSVFQFAGGAARGVPGGSLRRRKQMGKHAAGFLLALATIFLFQSGTASAQQIQPIYLARLLAGQGAVAESGTTITGLGGPAYQATMNYTSDVTTDKYGNIYFTDDANCAILEIAASTGNLSVVAGVPGTCGNNGDGPAAATQISEPMQLAFDNAGNLVFADYANYAVRQVVFAANGANSCPNNSYPCVVTLAGVLGTDGYAGDKSIAGSSTKFHSPIGVTVDKFGNLYIADTSNYRLRQILFDSTQTGNHYMGAINTIAGTGKSVNSINPVYSNIPGAAQANSLTLGFDNIEGVAADAAGNLYVGTYATGMVDMYIPPAAGPNAAQASPGTLVTIAGTGTAGSAYAGCTTPSGVTITAVTGVSGCAVASPLSDNRQAVSDFKGNVIASDEDDVIRWISNGVMSTLVGHLAKSYTQLSTVNSATPADYLTNPTQYQPATNVYLGTPYAVKNDWYNNLYITDTHAYQVVEATYNTNFPVTNVGSASLSQPIYSQQTSGATITLASIATSPSPEFALGTLSGCTATGTLKTATSCITPVTFNPVYPGMRTGQLTFKDSKGNVSPIGLVGIGVAPQASFSQATFATLTGTGTAGGGAGQVSAPRGGSVDSLGNVYFADSGNNEIKEINAKTGAVTVVAGNGTSGYSGDGAAATAAELNAPAKVIADSNGNLFIADTGNNVIREVSASTGFISTVAGNGTAGYTGDNGLATAAELNAPQGLAVDPGGRVYVADTGNNVLRYFGVGGLITTIAGNGTAGYSGDGFPAAAAELNAPTAVTVDAYGDLFIADTGNDVVREVTSTTNNLTVFGNISTIAGTQGSSTNSGSGNTATLASLNAPSDVAVDAAGDVYITAGGQIFVVNTSGVLSTLAGTGATGSYSGDGNPIATTVLPAPATNIALDGAANLYVFETSANVVLEATPGTPAALNLGKASQGTSGAPQVITLTNTGNATLNLSGVAVSSTEFTIDSSTASACSSSTTLAAGASCTITIAFTPASADADGGVAGTLTITDNSLNGASTQTIPLSGTAKYLAPTTIALSANPASPFYGSTYMVTAQVSGGASPTGTVSFTVDGVPLQSTPLAANGTASAVLTATAAGPQVVQATYSGDDNNAASSVKQTITVQPVALTVTATNAAMTAGSTVPSFTYTITGFVNGDTQAGAVTGAPNETTTATSDSPAGSYPIVITQGTLAAANYSFNMVNGTLTVGPPLLPASGSIGLLAAPVISTVAGDGSENANNNSGATAATSAGIGMPHGVAVDKAGNIFIANSYNSVIHEVNAQTGLISIVAGQSSNAGYSGDGGLATNAQLNGAYGVSVDNNGNLLIADSSNYCVRRVNMQTGIISTAAGTCGTYGYSGDGGPATSALLHGVYSAATDAAGNIYIADYSNDNIRRVDAKTGIITTFAGQASPGYAGDGGPASAAYLYAPYQITFDPAGNMLIGEYDNHVIRKINMQTGIISTIAGVGGELVAYSTTPAPTESNGCTPIDSVGDECPATSATFNHPRGAVADSYGNIWIADEDNYIVRVITPDGIIHLAAGNGTEGYAGDGGLGTSGEVSYVYGVALDTQGNVLVVDPGEYRIRKLSFNYGLPATAIGAVSKSQPLFTVGKAAYTPATEQLNNAEFTLGAVGCPPGSQVAADAPCSNSIAFKPALPGLQTAQYAIGDADGNASAFGLYAFATAPEASFFDQATISTIAGNGTAGNNGGNGSQASQATLNAPAGGVIDSRGFIYFADSANNEVRRISPTGGIVTLAGNGTAGFSGDGGAATAAELNNPTKVIVDPAGDLYIADTGNNRIRFVNVATGVISTVAGNGTAGYAGDGGAATAAELNKPQGLAIDLGGFVYVADTGNNAIRVFGNGYITTLTGTGTAGYSGDGGNEYGAQLNAPQAVALDLQGNVYIADTGNDVIRELAAPANVITTIAGQKGSSSNGGDGGTALAATLAAPTDIAFDPAGDLYIAAGGVVRQINTSGTIGTIAGSGVAGNYSGEGGPASNAVIPSPANNLFVDSLGDVYISDTAGNRLLEVAVSTPATLNLGTQTPGTSSAAQIITFQNTGNSGNSVNTNVSPVVVTPSTPLTISNIATTGNFLVQTGASTACAVGQTLNPGQSCTVSVVFNPQATDSGAETGTLVITDNSLNSTTGATHTVTLAGTAQAVAATTTTLTAANASYTYGSTTTVTAAVTGSGSPTGSVSFTVNDTYIGSATLVNGQATITLPKSLAAGASVVAATYAGDANDGSSSGTANITITPAVLTVTAANASFITGAAQLPVFTYTISGFVNGDTAASAVSGAPAETTTATLTSAVGTYPITITAGTLASTNYTFTFINGTLTIQPTPPADFSLAATPVSLTIDQGSTGATTLTLTPLYGYQGTINLSCGSLPRNMLCTFTSATATTDSAGDALNTTLTLSTNNQPYVGTTTSSIARPSPLWLAFGLPLCCLGMALRGRERRKWLARMMGLLLLGVVALGASSCAENLGSAITAPGTYQVTVTAADKTANLSHTVTLNVTVQSPAVK